MKISYNWLKEYINIDIPAEELSTVLTDIGLEVEGIEEFEEVKGGLKGFVIGHVVSCGKHPNADKLSVTKVDVGQDENLDVVCGAPNVAAGQKVVVATVGTELYTDEGSFKIKKSKIRGEVSEGMICAEDELGLGTSHDGIMVLDDSAVVGTPAADYFNIQTDTVFEIGLTPNRVDSASHFGVARDVAAFYAIRDEKTLTKPAVDNFKIDNTSNVTAVELLNTDGCKRYAGITITGVKIAPSPDWLQFKLKSIGLSPINNVVDITNFILHELAQPLHAFDADQLAGNKIEVKKLPAGTKFVTLDEVERELHQDDLMICDAEKPVCIGGVFGGLHSGVTDETTTVFLESAYFDPVHVRKTAKRHGLNTDASFRFERGIDPDITIYALKRAAMLIKEVAGGEITSDITDIYPEKIADFEVKVKYAHIERLIGKHISKDTIEKILKALEIEYISDNCEEMHLRVPSYRVDVTREADIIEDILRIYGYNNVEFSSQLKTSITPSDKPEHEKMVNRVSDYLAASGFTEIMSNSLTKKTYYENLKTYPVDQCVEIINPLSADLNVMRQTLLFSGLEAIQLNINHKKQDLQLFEYGKTYQMKGSEKSDYNSYSEERKIALFITGKRNSNSWAVGESDTSFFQLKAHLSNFLKKLGYDISVFKTESLEALDDVYAGGLSYSLNGKTIANAGVVSGEVLSLFDIDQQVYVAEINWTNLFSILPKPALFTELPKQLPIRRDLALLIDEQVSFEEIERLAKKAEKKLLREVGLFDFYKGKGIPEGKKSYGVFFQLLDEEKTLTDKVIEKTMNRIVQIYQRELNAELR